MSAETIIGIPVVWHGSKPFPGEQWQPSNGTEGYCFIERWCGTCTKDKPSSEGKPFDDCAPEDLCEELAASFRGEAEHWRHLESDDCVCLLWTPAGGVYRCDRTEDMFK